MSLQRAPSRAELEAFLAERHGAAVGGLEQLGGGGWSTAWGYQLGGEELVVRFGADTSWYEADRSAMAFSGPDLPVPAVHEVGRAPWGQAYAISARRRGRFLEEFPEELAPALAPALGRLLVALHGVPAPPASPVLWHQPSTSAPSWRAFLLAGLVDDPARVVHGWSAPLAADPQLSSLSQAVAERVRELAGSCPERRDLVHGDLLHANVLCSPDARRIEAVFSWKCSVRGDFLFDAAWCTFWGRFHPAIAAADPLGLLLAAPSVRADPGALTDAAQRHHCYELQIGFTHLGWNLWVHDREALQATAARLSEVFERGPLSLARAGGDGLSAAAR